MRCKLGRERASERYIFVFLLVQQLGAIHLELAEDCTAEAFVRTFRRFVARRSCPKLVISDNATTFKSAAVSLYELRKSVSVDSHMVLNRLKYHFIPARAPWQGGFYERLIGLTKSTLKKILGHSYSYLELNTICTEIESMLNDRPLTYSSDHISDASPVTPSHLLYGYRLTSIPNENVYLSNLSDPSLFDKHALSGREIRCRLLVDNFWTRWRSEYLLALRERDRNLTKNVSIVTRVGNIVLVHDDGPRLHWKLEQIVSVSTSDDGCIMSARVASWMCVVSRPVTKLYPMEVTTVENVDEVQQYDNSRKTTNRRSAIETSRRISN